MMAQHLFDDNYGRTSKALLKSPEAHGQAALLLTESLIHTLIGQSYLTVDEAVAIVAVAAEVETEAAGHPDDCPTMLSLSLTILGVIEASLRHDLHIDRRGSLG